MTRTLFRLRFFGKVLVVAGLALIGGCAVNGFERFYIAQPGADSLKNNPLVESHSGEPKIYSYSDDPKSDVTRLLDEGYVQIGSSAFYGPPNTMTQAQLVVQAERVGASLVLVHSQYKDTLSGVVPYTVANPSQVTTVNTIGTASAYGSGGYATGNYSSQSIITSPGGTSTYAIPYSVSRNDVIATYWVHLNTSKIRLGVRAEPLPDDLRAKLQRNTGLVVGGVIRGTPAFRANILRGDVILRLNGEEVYDPKAFYELLNKFEGQSVNIELLRGDKSMTIAATLNRHDE